MRFLKFIRRLKKIISLSFHRKKNGYVAILLAVAGPALIYAVRWGMAASLFSSWMVYKKDSNDVYKRCATAVAFEVAKNFNPAFTFPDQKSELFKLAARVYNMYPTHYSGSAGDAIPGLERPDRLSKSSFRAPASTSMSATHLQITPEFKDFASTSTTQTISGSYPYYLTYKAIDDLTNTSSKPFFALVKENDFGNIYPKKVGLFEDLLSVLAINQANPDISPLYNSAVKTDGPHLTSTKQYQYYLRPDPTGGGSGNKVSLLVYQEGSNTIGGIVNNSATQNNKNNKNNKTQNDSSSDNLKISLIKDSGTDPKLKIELKMLKSKVSSDDSSTLQAWNTEWDTATAIPAKCNVDIVLSIPTNAAACSPENLDSAYMENDQDYIRTKNFVKENYNSSTITKNIKDAGLDGIEPNHTKAKDTPIYQIAHAYQKFLRDNFIHARGVSVGIVPYSGKLTLRSDRKDWTTKFPTFIGDEYIQDMDPHRITRRTIPVLRGCTLYGTKGVEWEPLSEMTPDEKTAAASAMTCIGDPVTKDGKTTYPKKDAGKYTPPDATYNYNTALYGVPIMFRRGHTFVLLEDIHDSAIHGSALTKQDNPKEFLAGGNPIYSGDILSNVKPEKSKLNTLFFQMNMQPCYEGYANLLGMYCEKNCTTYMPNPYYVIELTPNVEKICDLLSAFYPFYDQRNASSFSFLAVTWANNLFASWTDDPVNKQKADISKVEENVAYGYPIESKQTTGRKKVVILMINKPDAFEAGELTYLGFNNDYSQLHLYESDKVDFKTPLTTTDSGSTYYRGYKNIIKVKKTSFNSQLNDINYNGEKYTIQFPEKGRLRIRLSGYSYGTNSGDFTSNKQKLNRKSPYDPSICLVRKSGDRHYFLNGAIATSYSANLVSEATSTDNQKREKTIYVEMDEIKNKNDPKDKYYTFEMYTSKGYSGGSITISSIEISNTSLSPRIEIYKKGSQFQVSSFYGKCPFKIILKSTTYPANVNFSPLTGFSSSKMGKYYVEPKNDSSNPVEVTIESSNPNSRQPYYKFNYTPKNVKVSCDITNRNIRWYGGTSGWMDEGISIKKYNDALSSVDISDTTVTPSPNSNNFSNRSIHGVGNLQKGTYRSFGNRPTLYSEGTNYLRLTPGFIRVNSVNTQKYQSTYRIAKRSDVGDNYLIIPYNSTYVVDNPSISQVESWAKSLGSSNGSFKNPDKYNYKDSSTFRFGLYTESLDQEIWAKREWIAYSVKEDYHHWGKWKGKIFKYWWWYWDTRDVVKHRTDYSASSGYSYDSAKSAINTYYGERPTAACTKSKYIHAEKKFKTLKVTGEEKDVPQTKFLWWVIKWRPGDYYIQTIGKNINVQSYYYLVHDTELYTTENCLLDNTAHVAWTLEEIPSGDGEISYKSINNYSCKIGTFQRYEAQDTSHLKCSNRNDLLPFHKDNSTQSVSTKSSKTFSIWEDRATPNNYCYVSKGNNDCFILTKSDRTELPRPPKANEEKNLIDSIYRTSRHDVHSSGTSAPIGEEIYSLTFPLENISNYVSNRTYSGNVNFYGDGTSTFKLVSNSRNAICKITTSGGTLKYTCTIPTSEYKNQKEITKEFKFEENSKELDGIFSELSADGTSYACLLNLTDSEIVSIESLAIDTKGVQGVSGALPFLDWTENETKDQITFKSHNKQIPFKIYVRPTIGSNLKITSNLENNETDTATDKKKDENKTEDDSDTPLFPKASCVDYNKLEKNTPENCVITGEDKNNEVFSKTIFFDYEKTHKIKIPSTQFEKIQPIPRHKLQVELSNATAEITISNQTLRWKGGYIASITDPSAPTFGWADEGIEALNNFAQGLTTMSIEKDVKKYFGHNLIQTKQTSFVQEWLKDIIEETQAYNNTLKTNLGILSDTEITGTSTDNDKISLNEILTKANAISSANNPTTAKTAMENFSNLMTKVKESYARTAVEDVENKQSSENTTEKVAESGSGGELPSGMSTDNYDLTPDDTFTLSYTGKNLNTICKIPLVKEALGYMDAIINRKLEKARALQNLLNALKETYSSSTYATSIDAVLNDGNFKTIDGYKTTLQNHMKNLFDTTTSCQKCMGVGSSGTSKTFCSYYTTKPTDLGNDSGFSVGQFSTRNVYTYYTEIYSDSRIQTSINKIKHNTTKDGVFDKFAEAFIKIWENCQINLADNTKYTYGDAWKTNISYDASKEAIKKDDMKGYINEFANDGFSLTKYLIGHAFGLDKQFITELYSMSVHAQTGNFNAIPNENHTSSHTFSYSDTESLDLRDNKDTSYSTSSITSKPQINVEGSWTCTGSPDQIVHSATTHKKTQSVDADKISMYEITQSHFTGYYKEGDTHKEYTTPTKNKGKYPENSLFIYYAALRANNDIISWPAFYNHQNVSQSYRNVLGYFIKNSIKLSGSSLTKSDGFLNTKIGTSMLDKLISTDLKNINGASWSSYASQITALQNTLKKLFNDHLQEEFADKSDEYDSTSDANVDTEADPPTKDEQEAAERKAKAEGDHDNATKTVEKLIESIDCRTRFCEVFRILVEQYYHSDLYDDFKDMETQIYCGASSAADIAKYIQSHLDKTYSADNDPTITYKEVKETNSTNNNVEFTGEIKEYKFSTYKNNLNSYKDTLNSQLDTLKTNSENVKTKLTNIDATNKYKANNLTLVSNMTFKDASTNSEIQIPEDFETKTFSTTSTPSIFDLYSVKLDLYNLKKKINNNNITPSSDGSKDSEKEAYKDYAENTLKGKIETTAYTADIFCRGRMAWKFSQAFSGTITSSINPTNDLNYIAANVAGASVPSHSDTLELSDFERKALQILGDDIVSNAATDQDGNSITVYSIVPTLLQRADNDKPEGTNNDPTPDANPDNAITTNATKAAENTKPFTVSSNSESGISISEPVDFISIFQKQRGGTNNSGKDDSGHQLTNLEFHYNQKEEKSISAKINDKKHYAKEDPQVTVSENVDFYGIGDIEMTISTMDKPHITLYKIDDSPYTIYFENPVDESVIEITPDSYHYVSTDGNTYNITADLHNVEVFRVEAEDVSDNNAELSSYSRRYDFTVTDNTSNVTDAFREDLETLKGSLGVLNKEDVYYYAESKLTMQSKNYGPSDANMIFESTDGAPTGHTWSGGDESANNVNAPGYIRKFFQIIRRSARNFVEFLGPKTTQIMFTDFSYPINSVLLWGFGENKIYNYEWQYTSHAENVYNQNMRLSRVTNDACEKLKTDYKDVSRIYVVKFRPQTDTQKISGESSYSLIGKCASRDNLIFEAKTEKELQEALQKIADDIKEFADYQPASILYE